MFCGVIVFIEVLIIVLWFLNGSYFYLNFIFSFSRERRILLYIIIIGLDIDLIENFNFGDIVCFFWFYEYFGDNLYF